MLSTNESNSAQQLATHKNEALTSMHKDDLSAVDVSLRELLHSPLGVTPHSDEASYDVHHTYCHVVKRRVDVVHVCKATL